MKHCIILNKNLTSHIIEQTLANEQIKNTEMNLTFVRNITALFQKKNIKEKNIQILS